MKRVILLPLLALAVFAPTAAAVEEAGRGEAIEHIKNIAYPNLNAEDETNAGTDIEFATLGIPRETTETVVRKVRRGKARRCTALRKARTNKARRRARRCQARRRKQRRTRVVTEQRTSVVTEKRTFAFAGSYGDGLQIIDVTDPENSKLVSTWDCGVSQGDVQVFQRKDLDGRWFVTYTHDDGYDFHLESQCAEDLKAMGIDVTAVPPPDDPDGQLWVPESFYGAGTYIADVTDPYNPKTVSFVPVSRGSHNQTVHPSGRYLYNSNSDLITSVQPSVEVYDISDITNPEQVGDVTLKTLPGLGTESHDIVFSQDGTRAYVAALSHGEILDTTDPANPVSIGTVVDPAINVWHQMEDVTIDDPILGERRFLIAEDEVAGASGTGQCPNGGVHVYDITGDLEQAPVKVGMWNIDDVGLTEDGLGTCTAHVFQIHEQEKLMTIAYYNGGVRVVDLSGLVGVALGANGVGMKQLGWYRFADGDAWSVKAPVVSRDGFYMYANDHRRGFDVYKWAPAAAESSVSAGKWLNAKQALNASRQIGAGAKVGSVCILRG